MTLLFPQLGATKAERTRLQILDAALQLVGERDLEAVVFGDVAARAGVSRATVYNYFESPERLFAELADVFRAEIDRHLDQVETVIEDPLERITDSIFAVLARGRQTPQWAAFVVKWRNDDASLSIQNHLVRWVGDESAAHLIRSVVNYFLLFGAADPTIHDECRRVVARALVGLGADPSLAERLVEEHDPPRYEFGILDGDGVQVGLGSST